MNNIVIQYLLSIKDRVLLYENNIFCLRLLKILGTDISKIIIELLCVAKHVKNIKEDKNSYKILKNLNIIYKNGNNIYLNNVFLSSLKKSFMVKNPSNIFFESYEIEEQGALEEKKVKIMQLIVEKMYNPNLSRINNLMKYKKILKDGEITQKGFEFLLKTKREQFWELILYSVDFLEEINKDIKIELLIMVFEMGNCGGKFYKVKVITEAQKSFLKYLEELGFVRILPDGIIIYNEMKWLFSSSKETNDEYLIVETNFKIYAYCSYLHDISILKIFCTLDLTLPNLVTGMITEESVAKAFNKGIKAEQIVHYLRSVTKRKFPETVKEQIFIWENNRNRIHTEESYLYSNFSGYIQYKKVLEFVQENNFLLEKDDDKRILIVTVDGHKMVKNFIKSSN